MELCIRKTPARLGAASLRTFSDFSIIPKLNRLVISAAISVGAIGFALANGLQYGRSNHWQYLLHGLRAADPGFLRADWFTTRTASHHRLFNTVVQLAASTGRPEVVLGLLNAATAIAFAFSLYFIVARFAKQPLLPFALVLVLAAGIPINGLGDSSILLPYFVPSDFAAVALVAALTCLLYSRDAPAGLIAAAGCAMHANFLLLVGPLWCLVLAFDAPGRSWRRAAWLLVPWLAAWLPHLAYLWAMLRDPGPSAAARRVFWDIYAPFHYRPLTWHWGDYFAFTILLAGGLCAAAESGITFGRTSRAIIAALAVVVATGAIGTIGWPIDFITAIYTWRLAPFLVLFALVTIALAVTEGRSTPVRDCIVGLAMAAVVRLARLPELSCAAIVVACACSLIGNHILRKQPRARARLAAVLGVAAICVVGGMLARHGLWRRDMFGRAYRPTEESLFSWCRENTDPDAVFIIPPNLAPFRLGARRAVLADWKCMPLLPHDQMEWLKRNECLAGRPISSEADSLAGYAEMDAARARTLSLEFGCQYVVVDRNIGSRSLKPLQHVYSNTRFDVFATSVGSSTLRR